MSIGLLIVTHGDIGQALYDAATHVIGSSPIRTRIIALHAADDRTLVERKVTETIIELDTGQGVLILTDMYGATPSNIACMNVDQRVEIVAGLNLPMLIRIMNYPNLRLHELVQKAVSGGKEGIMYYQLSKEKYGS